MKPSPISNDPKLVRRNDHDRPVESSQAQPPVPRTVSFSQRLRLSRLRGTSRDLPLRAPIPAGDVDTTPGCERSSSTPTRRFQTSTLERSVTDPTAPRKEEDRIESPTVLGEVFAQAIPVTPAIEPVDAPRLPAAFVDAVIAHASIQQPEPGRFVLQMDLILPGMRRLEIESLGSMQIKLRVRAQRGKVDAKLLGSLVTELEARGLRLVEVIDEADGESA